VRLRLYAFIVISIVIVHQTKDCFAQTSNFWNTLAQVHFKSKTHKDGYDIEYPVFSNYLRSFQGKEVTLKGYMIPLEELGSEAKFMLSSVPFNMCFYCGAAGPETIVEVDTKLSIKFTTKPIVLRGVLYLNESDPEHHMYILKQARLIN
jgi:hypothetical protein